MRHNFPDYILLSEVGPRDGFQFEKKLIPIDLKLDIIAGLVDAGLKKIQVTSFVLPERVPQLADAETLIARLPQKDGVDYYGLVLNMTGLERAYSAGLGSVEISISCSDTHSRRNTGMSIDQALKQGIRMIARARSHKMQTMASIQCAFGCVFEGAIIESRVVETARALTAAGIDMLGLADTTGMANPLKIKSLVNEVKAAIGNTPLALHLHDTRGLGLVNVMAGIECGINNFDTALGGMGGCPFIPGATGNIATEDTAYLIESMNINTGIDIPCVARCSLMMGEYLNKQFPGKIYLLENSRFQMKTD
ncbi:MAG: hydroxymethylglutaryl-CoA lyase [Desulfobacteraceae bacterium 4572_123]|nr:MAG: hydroxymethylglutaryl-CoA lyase [Desulfobacteraceae bacterium 4572_123]